jgi:CBS domain-containing protein
MAITVQEILAAKGGVLHTVKSSTTVYDALKMMEQYNISAVLIVDGGALTGIFTERDYARKVALRGISSKDTWVGDLMTHKILTVCPSHTVDEGQLVGLISIGDVVKSIMDLQKETISQLSGYISGNLTTA